MNELSIGERLRQARERRPVSLFEASRETKIRVDFLQAMERDSFRFVSVAYAKGMLRGYSRWLGLDEDALADEFDRHSGAAGGPSVKQIFKEPAQAPPRSPRSRWSMAAAAAAMALLALSLVGVVNPRQSQVAAPPGPQTRAEISPEVPSETEDRIEQQPIAQARVTGVDLEITVSGDRCWILVTAENGTPVFQGTLSTGDVRTFQSPNRLQVLFGNMGAVRLRVNGKDIGSPGSPRKTGTLVFTPDGVSRLERS